MSGARSRQEDEADEWAWVREMLRAQAGPETGNDEQEQVDEESFPIGRVLAPAVCTSEPAPTEYDEGMSDASSLVTLEPTTRSASPVDHAVDFVPTPMEYMDGVAYRPGNAFSIMAARRTLAAREQAAAEIDQPSADNEPVEAAASASDNVSVTDLDWVLELPPCPYVSDGSGEELALLNQQYAGLSGVIQETLAAVAAEEAEDMDEAE